MHSTASSSQGEGENAAQIEEEEKVYFAPTAVAVVDADAAAFLSFSWLYFKLLNICVYASESGAGGGVCSKLRGICVCVLLYY